jgi:hypothetical protein
MKALPASGAFNLLLLCHTLAEREYGSAIRLTRERWPKITPQQRTRQSSLSLRSATGGSFAWRFVKTQKP